MYCVSIDGVIANFDDCNPKTSSSMMRTHTFVIKQDHTEAHFVPFTSCHRQRRRVPRYKSGIINVEDHNVIARLINIF